MENKQGSLVAAAGRVAGGPQAPLQLPAGFRFRPTDLELVAHYLRRRALAWPLPAAVNIPDVRILSHDPSDLVPPGSNEQERYFFTCTEAKYVKGHRANRATGAGYWKATGKEKPVTVNVPPTITGEQREPVVVGMKRSLVFYRGKSPSGVKTEWIMHEYRLAGAGLAPCRRAPGVVEFVAPINPAEGWVLCRIFRKVKGAASDRIAPAAAAQVPAAQGPAAPPNAGIRFIDFFARAASPPSASCITDASAEHPREQQETASS